MKRFLKYLGFGIFSVVIFIVGAGVFALLGSADKEEVFVPYIVESVPKLATWDIEQYRLLMTKQGMESATLEQWRLYLDLFKRLGELQSVGEPELQNWKATTEIGAGNTTYAVYLVPLSFNTGDAHVLLGLQYNSEKVEINSVRFFSDLLLK